MFDNTPEKGGYTTPKVSSATDHLARPTFGPLYTFRAKKRKSNPGKSAVWVEEGLDTSLVMSQEDMDSRCSQRLSQHRPDPTAVEASPVSKIPRIISSPGGTFLYRYGRIGPRVTLYLEEKPQTYSPIKTVSFEPHITDSAVLPAPDNHQKYQELRLTKEDYLARIEQRSTQKHRSPSQPSAMGRKGRKKYASATREAEKVGFKPGAFEWLHLIAYFMYGNEGQKHENLVGGTRDANTAMMFVEEFIPLLLENFPFGIVIKVAADLFPGTHFAKNIIYKIETILQNGNTKTFMTFEFDAQRQSKPDMIEREYLGIYIELMVEKACEKLGVSRVTSDDAISVSASPDSSQFTILDVDTVDNIDFSGTPKNVSTLFQTYNPSKKMKKSEGEENNINITL